MLLQAIRVERTMSSLRPLLKEVAEMQTSGAALETDLK